MKQRIKELRFAINVLKQLQAEGPYDYSSEIAAANERLNDLINQSTLAVKNLPIKKLITP